MGLYSIYKNEEGTIKAVKQGFTWAGWLYGWFWCFFKKMYLHGIVFFIINFIIVVFFVRGNNWGILLQFLLMEWIGFNGNKYLREKLSQSGFEYVDDILANNSKSAISIFMERQYSGDFLND